MSERYIVEDRIAQGQNEQIVYALDTTPWGGSPTGVSVKAYTVSIDGVYADVTSTVFPTNAPTVSGDDITLSPLRNLTAGTLYRIETRFTSGGQIYEPLMMIRGER